MGLADDSVVHAGTPAAIAGVGTRGAGDAELSGGWVNALDGRDRVWAIGTCTVLAFEVG
jgi:hypothetical protein